MVIVLLNTQKKFIATNLNTRKAKIAEILSKYWKINVSHNGWYLL